MTDPPGLAPVDGSTDLPIAPVAMAVLESLWAAGHAALVVGGSVRDLLLGQPTGDWDVATDARPERVLEIFPDGVYENRFGTVSLGNVQITTFRRDHRYADHRRPEFVTFTDDAFEDLARRDLTINAIAWGRLRPGSAARRVDPADGIADLRAGIVRAVGDPDARFDEDALRMLRAVRIAAQLAFRVEPRTLAAIRDHAADVAWVSEERIGTEIRLMLASPRPSDALRLLRDTGIIEVILPEVAAALEGGAAAGDARLAAIDAIAAAHRGNERLALAALVADLAGPSAQEGAIERSLSRLRIAQREIAAIARIVAAAREPYASSWSDADVRRYLARTRPDLVEDALALRAALAEAAADRRTEADGDGRTQAAGDGRTQAAERPSRTEAAELTARVREQMARAVPLSLADLAIDGDDLRSELFLPEGPTIGELLTRALGAVIEDPAINDRQTLLRLARSWVAERME